MNIAVLNFSGNVGKSTLARHLLAPRLDNCAIIPVETVNENEIESPSFKGKNFKDVLVELVMYDNAIVDIGSSNIEQVFEQLKKITGSHEDFDYYVVPTVPSVKQQADTMSLITALAELGVEDNKIRIVFNQVESDDEVEKLFPILYNYCKDSGIPTDTAVYQNDLFSMLHDKEIADVVNEDKGIKEKLATAESIEEKRELANVLTVARLAKGVEENLDRVFEALFK